MKYIHYTVEDFVNDEYFQKWALDSDAMTTKFWNSWMAKHPEKVSILEEAKQLILLLDFDTEKLSESDFDMMWQHIIEKRTSTPAPKQIQSKTKVRPLYWRYAAAAILVGILAGTYIFKDNIFTSPQGFVEPIIVNNTIETGTDKATLTLETGEIVALEKGKTYQTQNATSNGEEITYINSTSHKLVYNYITIPRGGQFQMTLSDGTKVWLNSESQLKYPVSFADGESRQVELVYGEAYFDVSPSTEHNGSDFKVFNNNQEVEVLGTEFNIKAYKGETNVYTTLVEGKVAVTPNSDTFNTKILLPGQQSDFNTANKNIAINTVDIYNQVSWKKGVFSFENMKLSEVMKVMARWYDMEISIENKAIEQLRFTGGIQKSQRIVSILSVICNNVRNVSYEIHDKKVILKNTN
ncbi:FecR family protein [Flavivirga sp. 57AJ16]|uniref:FecR family protein n=1 Tax=Flavivirga sp. 57AJ16 TaxID=3025307 RepID=UPI0023656F7B|nr:FecR domain-containing protein [Flavivirga sp. 57AJ16]MDD7886794.1 DUF4974 domain-containing protein [Flavivirga sp. 57AJ16]